MDNVTLRSVKKLSNYFYPGNTFHCSGCSFGLLNPSEGNIDLETLHVLSYDIHNQFETRKYAASLLLCSYVETIVKALMVTFFFSAFNKLFIAEFTKEFWSLQTSLNVAEQKQAEMNVVCLAAQYWYKI